MGPFAWTEQIAAVGATLRTLEEQATLGQPAPPGLEELKSALDDLRLRAWGLLMATNADDQHGFHQRFRIRRGKDMCRALCEDLREKRLSGGHPDLPDLGAAARDLVTLVTKGGGKPPKTRRSRSADR